MTSINRRTYLKGTTAAVAGTAIAAASGGSGDEDDYEVIEADGSSLSVHCGETFENKLIDVSNGEAINISVTGGWTTIRNIGFKGVYRGDGFIFSIGAQEGPILFENVYLGDGATKEGADFVHGPGAIFYTASAGADVTFRNMNVQGYPNNGFYCSNNADGGKIKFDTCYGKNNGVSTYRIANPEDEIINCVAYNDDTDYGEGYGGYVEENGRPVWAWNPGGFTIEDSHFADGPYSYAMVAGANDEPSEVNFNSGAISGEIHTPHGSEVILGDDVGDDPDLSVQDGVPTSAEEAASGEPQGSAFDEGDMDCPEHSDMPHLYEFVADGDAPADYYFEIEEGPIMPVTENGAIIDDDYHWIHEDGHKVAGRVHPGERHAYRFGTLIMDAGIDGPATAYINDTVSALDRYPQDGATGGDWMDQEFAWSDEEYEDDDPDEDDPDEDDPDEDDVTDDTDDVTDDVDDDTQVVDEDDDATDDTDDTDDDGIPGFTGVVTLGALAASGAAMIRRLRGQDED